MELHVEQTLIEYLEKYGYLFENDTSIIMEELEEEKIKEKYKKKKEELLKNKENILAKLKDFGKEVGANVADEMREEIEEKIKKIRTLYFARKQMLNLKQATELKNLKGKSGLVVSGAALAAMLIFTSFKLYRMEKQRTLKQCTDKEGLEKQICIKNHYKQALIKRLYFLKKSMYKCKYSKDPVKCKDKVDEEILKVEEKLKDFAGQIGNKMIKHFE